MLNKPKPDAVDSFDRVTSDIKARKRDVAFSGDSAAALAYASSLFSKSDNLNCFMELSGNLLQFYIGELVLATAVWATRSSFGRARTCSSAAPQTR